MAFEDRSSPNTASSPCSENSLNLNSPNSPESTRTSPYTCTTIPHQNEGNRTHSFTQKEHTFFSITSYALSSPKFPNLTAQKFQPPNDQKNSFLSRIDFLRAHEFRLSNDCTTAIPKIPNEATSKSPNPLLRSPSTDSTVSYNRSDNSNSPPPRNEDEVAADTLKYSIRNILQPEFGKNAVIRTKIFKPYENPDDQPTAPPLGSLCQTVSQIGKATCTTRPTTPLAKSSFAEESKEEGKVPQLWPAWVYCTRYSDRPSSGPRSRRMKKPGGKPATEDKRPRTAFSGVQLARLKHEFTENRYLTERRRQQLSQELGLNEAQIKIWFQNKRAKIKKSSGQKNPLALQLMAQGLYNHSTVACDEDEMSISA